jgi:hypothetical protein
MSWHDYRHQELVDSVKELWPQLEDRLRECAKDRPLPFALRLQLENLSGLLGLPNMRL